MADIDVVPKNKSRTWMWLILAVVIVGLLVWAMTGRTDAAGRAFAAPDAMGMGHITAPLLL
jgi:drug/metabolite transporter superfamily protein YnfA